MNITQAQAITIEQLDAMPTEELLAVELLLSGSESKKSTLKRDQIKIIIEKRKKEAKKAGDKEAQAEFQAIENSIKRPRKTEQEALPLEAEEEEEENILDTLTMKQIEKMGLKEIKALLKEHFGITTNERNLTNLRALLIDAISPEGEEEEEQEEEVGDDELAMHLAYLDQINGATTVKELKELASEVSVEVPKIIKLATLRSLLKEEMGISYLEKSEEKAKPEAKPVAKEKAKPDAKPSTDIGKLQKQMQEMQKQLLALTSENNKLKADIFPEEIETTKGSKLVATSFEDLTDIQKVLVEKPFQLYMQVHEGLDNVATTLLVVYANKSKLILVDKSRQIDSTLDLHVKDMTASTIQIDNRVCPYKFYVKQ